MIDWVDWNARGHSVSLEANIKEVESVLLHHLPSLLHFFILDMKMVQKILPLLLLLGNSPVLFASDHLLLLLMMLGKISLKALEF